VARGRKFRPLAIQDGMHNGIFFNDSNVGVDNPPFLNISFISSLSPYWSPLQTWRFELDINRKKNGKVLSRCLGGLAGMRSVRGVLHSNPLDLLVALVNSVLPNAEKAH
jgi:hypothetical protein